MCTLGGDDHVSTTCAADHISIITQLSVTFDIFPNKGQIIFENLLNTLQSLDPVAG